MDTSINSHFVIPAKAGIQSNKAPGSPSQPALERVVGGGDDGIFKGTRPNATK